VPLRPLFHFHLGLLYVAVLEANPSNRDIRLKYGHGCSGSCGGIGIDELLRDSRGSSDGN